MGKRAFDLVISILLLLVGIPVWILIALAIKLESRGPVFYTSVRVGRDGQHFTLCKFRSMSQGMPGAAITSSGDPRVTRVGLFLRRTKLDEMPQLVNVLKGEMSLVGPRPEDPRYIALYNPEQRKVLSIRPGITSPAAVAYRREEALLASIGGDVDESYATRVMPHKLELDLAYVGDRSFFGDLKVLWHTVFFRSESVSDEDPRA